MTLLDASKVALEAFDALIYNKPYAGRFGDALTDLRKAIEREEAEKATAEIFNTDVATYREFKVWQKNKQEAQEPVGEITYRGFGYVKWVGDRPPIGTKLYTSPQPKEWVGLTIEERDNIYNNREPYADLIAIEQLLKEKNQ